MWKRRLGSGATYYKLISIFERADYQNYADFVKTIIHVSESETADFKNASHFPWPLQPQTYPHHEPPQNLELPLPDVSSSEEYIYINAEFREDLPKGTIEIILL